MLLSAIITRDTTEIIKNLLTSIAILIGDGWTFWKFIIQREGRPKIELRVDLRVLGLLHDQYIVEVIAIGENKGLVREYVRDFNFSLFYLSDQHPINDGDEKILNQIQFERRIHKRKWIPADWEYTVFDPGIKQYYTYITHLPGNTKFALVQSRFNYSDKKSDFQSSQKTFAIQLPSEIVKQEA